MPHRTLRRAGIARIPLRLVILVILAAAALAATGCSDDDGLTPYAPDRGLAGRWLRYDPVPGRPTEFRAGFTDTLELGADGSVRHSFELPVEVPQPGQPPMRAVVDMRLVVRRPLLLLELPPTCAACDDVGIAGPPPAPRRETSISGPIWRIVRRGPDRFELEFVYDPDGQRQYFRRDTSAPTLP